MALFIFLLAGAEFALAPRDKQIGKSKARAMYLKD
jgi:cbb3-type cytochrome oxidase subunit 3